MPKLSEVMGTSEGAQYMGAMDKTPKMKLSDVMGGMPADDEKLLNSYPKSKREGLKNVWKGITGTTPEEMAKAGHPVAAGLEQTAEDIFTIPAHFFNQMFMNYPRAALYKAGYDYPEAKSTAGKVLSKTAGVVGGFKNPLLKLLGVGEITTPAAEAAQGAILGGSYAPTEDIVGLKQRTMNTALGAITPLAIKGGQNLIMKIPGAKNEFAGRLINSMIKPLKNDFSYGRNPGLAVAQEKIVANNLDELTTKITERKNEIGERIQTVLKNPINSKKTINLTDALNPIDNAIKKAQESPLTNKNVITRLQELKNDILGTNVQAGEFKGRFPLNTKRLSPSEATDLKRKVGELTRWTGNASDDKIVNKALKQVYGGIKSKIGQVVPEVQGLNERYADLLSAEHATKYRDLMNQKQTMSNMADWNTGLGTAMLDYIIHGHNAPEAIVAGLGVAGLRKAISSPAVKTRIASWLSKAPASELEGAFVKYPEFQKALGEAFNGIGWATKKIYDEPMFSGKVKNN